MKNVISFAKKFTAVIDNTIKIILNARKSLVFNSNIPWTKKTSENFDVAMGSFNGAEICELVGLFVLYRLASVLGKENVGLYRDDGLAVLRNNSGLTMERTRKKITRVFQSRGLRITSECNLSRTDFLDVCFNLNEETYIPYRKPYNTSLYIHDQSNHPPIIKKHLPQMIGQRISDLSFDKAAFEKAAFEYNQALQRSGFKHTIIYKPCNPPHTVAIITTRKRESEIFIWFSPPFSKNVATNIGKEFLFLLSKHFPPNNRYHKIFNKQNVKLNYSCMPNMGSIIAKHFKQVLNRLSSADTEIPPCNCRNKRDCR